MIPQWFPTDLKLWLRFQISLRPPGTHCVCVFFFHLIYLVFLCFFFLPVWEAMGKAYVLVELHFAAWHIVWLTFQLIAAGTTRHASRGGLTHWQLAFRTELNFSVWFGQKKKKIANKIQQKKEEKKCHIWSWLGPRLRVLLLCMCNCGLIIAKDPTRYK